MPKHLPELGPISAALLGEEMVSWEDPRSLTWLSRTTANRPFHRLARFFEAQADKFLCGPASLSMVLNAIHVDSTFPLPMDPACEQRARRMNPDLPPNYSASFPRYTQFNIFGPQTKSIQQVYGAPDASGLVRPGMNLTELSGVLAAHGVASDIHTVRNPSDPAHVDNISHALSSEGQYLIGNFDRSIWGFKGRGHICPLGAYDPISRKVLLMDVNICGRWLWIDIGLLLKSMASPRGYLIARVPLTILARDES